LRKGRGKETDMECSIHERRIAIISCLVNIGTVFYENLHDLQESLGKKERRKEGKKERRKEGKKEEIVGGKDDKDKP
jgi:hypothetical protein